MSSRALRKMQQDDDLAKVKPDEEEDEDSVSSRGFGGARAKMPPHRNPFDLLNAPNSCSESEVKEDDDLGTESSRSRRAIARIEAEQRKKKKKRGGHNRSRMPPKSSEDNLEDDDDEVERSVREVNRILGEAPEAADASSSRQSAHKASSSVNLLAVEPKNLNPENEMKKIFGSRVVNNENKHHQLHKRRARAHPRHTHWIVVPKPSWPHPGKTGLAMKFVDSTANNGAQNFTFQHSPSYQQVQKRFFQAVESLNPDHIVQILNEHPFHIDSMLQLSEICKMGEDSQMASELIERTLYAMEAAFHPLFNISVGTSRLDYRRQENRAFFIALFRHLNYVGSRACHRTALEFCKLILSLDPDSDPLGILLLIDFYALRSQQHSWLIYLVETWEKTRNLSQLPNMAYSMALARFYSSKPAEDSKEADEALQKALIMFPAVLLPLLDKCSIEPATNVSSSTFFLEAYLKQPQALKLLCSLYVGRSFHLWKEASLLPWLERNVAVVLDRVRSNDPFVSECVEKRQKRYQGTPRNIYRHILLSDIKDATTSLPRELAETAVLSYDPLPPVDSIDTYKKSGSQGSRPNLDDPSAFRMFFRSLMPNFNPNDPQNAVERVDGAAGGNDNTEGQGDLRRSVTTLLDAMQDLLGGLHLPEVPNDADASADSDDEDDNWQ